MTERDHRDTITIPGAPDLPGLRFRRFRGSSDLPGMVAVLTAAHHADAVDSFMTVDDLAHDLDHAVNEDTARDLIVAEVDGRIVGYARASWSIRDGQYTYVSSGEVEPSVRRHGIGRALLHAEQDRLRSIAATHPADAEKRLQAWVFGGQVGCRALLRSEGYETIRYFSEMARSLADPIPDRVLPDGLEIRSVAPADHRRIFTAEAEAFRDHWGYREQTDDDLERTFGDPNLDTSLWRVAWDGDEVAGVILTTVPRAENAELGTKRGWLERISVRRPWRKRGVASALIVSAMTGLRDRGLDTAMLGVDAENPTGALRLYEALGFRVVDHGEVLSRELTDREGA
jgi:mycothiol synthase